MTSYTATYSPDDNKLRLYASSRLDEETYARVKAAGFKWAPKQGLFFAPAWTPEREDLLLELCGEIGDEDTSLVDRAEERAERFEEYSEKRGAEAARTLESVRQLADGIPLGQPILIGHHSEKRARKDAEKIQRGMQQAVRLWDTSKYWEDRAAGAIRHAKYKERPDVRARRIKTLEAERRKVLRSKEHAERSSRLWERLHEPDSVKRKDGEPTTFRDRALYVAGNSNTAPSGTWSDLRDEKITPEEAQARVLKANGRSIERADRWLRHLDNRLAYERAMLEEQGGTLTDRKGPEKGGAVRCLCGPRGGWAYIQKVNKVTVTVHHQWNDGGRVFRQNVPFDKLAAIMTAAEVEEARAAGRIKETDNGVGFYLLQTREEFDAAEAARAEPNEPTEVVAAPQLFPTPPELARQVVELADIQPGQRILEPSAGTGSLVEAAISRALGIDCCRIVAVEINPQLAEHLRGRRQQWLYANEANFDIRCADFLALNGELGKFDRIVMNPPFENAADIRHIEHARHFLKPGGRLVAICANGPRQRDRLQADALEWIDLPPGSFKSAGTNVNAALVVFDAPEEEPRAVVQASFFE